MHYFYNFYAKLNFRVFSKSFIYKPNKKFVTYLRHNSEVCRKIKKKIILKLNPNLVSVSITLPKNIKIDMNSVNSVEFASGYQIVINVSL